MENITDLLKRKLKLKVNKKKSTANRSIRGMFLGFTFYTAKGRYNIRIKDKIKKIASRIYGIKIELED